MSDLPRLAFIHIPKTAGTSVRDFFAKIYGDAVFPAMTTLDYACYSDEQLAQYRFFSGHAYQRDFTRLPSDTKFFTVLRNPIDRAISLYRYYAEIENTSEDSFIREAIDTAKNRGIVEFLYSNNPFLIEHLRAGQIRQFVSEPLLMELGHRRNITDDIERRLWNSFCCNFERFHYVFTVDFIEISLRCMCSVLSIGQPKLGKVNTSAPAANIDHMAVRRAIYDISPLDCRAYDYATHLQKNFLSAGRI